MCSPSSTSSTPARIDPTPCAQASLLYPSHHATRVLACRDRRWRACDGARVPRRSADAYRPVRFVLSATRHDVSWNMCRSWRRRSPADSGVRLLVSATREGRSVQSRWATAILKVHRDRWLAEVNRDCARGPTTLLSYARREVRFSWMRGGGTHTTDRHDPFVGQLCLC